jgi:hypothetical protein
LKDILVSLQQIAQPAPCPAGRSEQAATSPVRVPEERRNKDLFWEFGPSLGSARAAHGLPRLNRQPTVHHLRDAGSSLPNKALTQGGYWNAVQLKLGWRNRPLLSRCLSAARLLSSCWSEANSRPGTGLWKRGQSVRRLRARQQRGSRESAGNYKTGLPRRN